MIELNIETILRRCINCLIILNLRYIRLLVLFSLFQSFLNLEKMKIIIVIKKNLDG